jgi:hypothetical protein
MNPLTRVHLFLSAVNYNLMHYVTTRVETPAEWDINMERNCSNYVAEVSPEWANFGYFLTSYALLTM